MSTATSQIAPRTTRISLPWALGAICRCRPRTTPRSADIAWLSCTNGPGMPASTNRPWFQVSEKNPRPSGKRCGVSSFTSGMAVVSTIMPIVLSASSIKTRPEFGLAELTRLGAQHVVVDVAHAERDFLGAADQHAGARLDGLHERRGLQQRIGRAGVEPGAAARQALDRQQPRLEVDPVEVGDLQFAATRRANRSRQIADRRS